MELNATVIPLTEHSRVQLDTPFDLSEFRPTSIVVVHDDRVDDRFTKSIADAARKATEKLHVLPVLGGESLKALSGWQELLEFFQRTQLDRRGMVVAVGGGSVADAVGFAAATWLRGVDWVGVPTTLLGMVDAHIGGKTAVNLCGEKNRVGAFHLPRLVHIDRTALIGLPQSELISGWGEVLKTSLIGDPSLFECFEEGRRGPAASAEPSHDTIARCAAVKASIVREDFREGGRRRVLNLGHTLGHAVEVITDLSHGEAVAAGLVFAARVAHRMGIGSEDLESRILSILVRWKLPSTWPNDNPDRILDLMSRDKKTVAGEVWMALPVDVGHIEMHAVEAGVLRECLLESV